jgi:ABC-type antimicrobial peptide transport system permease subunit
MGVEENIQRTWDKYFPEYVNKSAFMDETINKFYKQEIQLTKLYQFFAILAILISCLGLYGLVSFMAVQKTKEVGIRKVLGASVSSIVMLFSKEFTMLIFVAFLVAAPLSWWLMSEWLNNFVFKIDMGVWIFITAILLSILIAWITVGLKAVRAALVNPVKSLRSE